MDQIVESSKLRWSDLTPEKICDELKTLTQKAKQMKVKQPSGIVILAGEITYATIRRVFPEDTETVRVKLCHYVKPDQCLIFGDRPSPIWR